jgi:uncharacterized protein (DUF2267 family)
MWYEEFVGCVAERTCIPSSEVNELVAAVFRALRECISGGEAEDLRAQMPKELQRELLRSQEEQARRFEIAEFARSTTAWCGASQDRAGVRARAVLDTLREAVSAGSSQDVLARVERELRSPPAGDRHTSNSPEYPPHLGQIR